jgi:hypothetical protein
MPPEDLITRQDAEPAGIRFSMHIPDVRECRHLLSLARTNHHQASPL